MGWVLAPFHRSANEGSEDLHSSAQSESQKVREARHECRSLGASKSLLLALGQYWRVGKEKIEGRGLGEDSPAKSPRSSLSEQKRGKPKQSTCEPETHTPGLGDDACEEDDEEGRAKEGKKVEEKPRSCHSHRARCAGSPHGNTLNPMRLVEGSSLTVSELRDRELKKQLSESTL